MSRWWRVRLASLAGTTVREEAKSTDRRTSRASSCTGCRQSSYEVHSAARVIGLRQSVAYRGCRDSGHVKV